jgi:hypothetical protein
MVLKLCALNIVCCGVNCGLKYQHSPMMLNSFLTGKFVSGILYPYNSDKTNAQKSDSSKKVNVYDHRMAHRHASFSAGAICRVVG